MRIPIGKILSLPISYKFNSYLTKIKDVCRMKNCSLFFRQKYFSCKKKRLIIGLSISQFNFEIFYCEEVYLFIKSRELTQI